MGEIKIYQITGTIVLSFIINNEQRDIMFHKDDKGYLESDGTTVWYVTDDMKEQKKYESITTANIIDVGLLNNSLMCVPVINLELETKTVKAKIKNILTVTPTGLKTEDDDN